jgi:hypothetical protein
MIRGYVDKDLQTRAPRADIGGKGKIATLDAVIDRGFNGHSRDTLIGASLLADKKLEINHPKQSVRVRKV